MNRARFTLLMISLCCAAVLMAPAGASAAADLKFDVQLATYETNPYTVVFGLDTSQDTTFIVMRGGVEVQRNDFGSGSEQHSFNAAIEPGDVVEAYQPMLPGGPPATTPIDSTTVTPLTVAATALSSEATGTAPDGFRVQVRRDWRCSRSGESNPATRTGGTFSALFDEPFAPGDRVSAIAVQPSGDRIYAGAILPGETPCIRTANNYFNAGLGPGYPPSYVTSNYLVIEGLRDKAITSTRVVVRRGDAFLTERSQGSGDYFQMWLTNPQRPLPGDTIEVFRPAEATVPLVSWTIPGMSATVDVASDLVSVRAPAAAFLAVGACRKEDCFGGVEKFVEGTKAGETLFSFKTGTGNGGRFAGFGGSPDADGYDILADDDVGAYWVSESGAYTYELTARPGDLTAPVGKLIAPRRMNLDSLPKVKVVSDEKATAWLELTAWVDRKLVVLASAKAKAKKGTTKIRLKLKSNRSGSHAAKLRLVLKDANGNRFEKIKRVRVKG